jgi:hypothetical protein
METSILPASGKRIEKGIAVAHVTLFRDEFHGPLDLHAVSTLNVRQTLRAQFLQTLGRRIHVHRRPS